jgi:hypothetical protein
MISYCEMRGWRDICEYLSTAYYHFCTVAEIRKKCPKALPGLYDPKNKTHRKPLWDAYKIQFLTWRQHPILDYHSSRRYRRQYKDEWGWSLVSDWEYKIDFLEHLVFTGNEPQQRLWLPALERRIIAREERERKLIEECKISQMTRAEKIKYYQEKGICWRCRSEILPLMIDCVVCGARQGED